MCITCMDIHLPWKSEPFYNLPTKERSFNNKKNGEFKPIYCTVLIKTAVQYNFWGSERNILSLLSYIRIVTENKMQPNPYARQTDN